MSCENETIPSFEETWEKIKDTTKWRQEVEFLAGKDLSREEATKAIKNQAKKMYDEVRSILKDYANDDRYEIYRSIYVSNYRRFIDQLRKTGKSMFGGKLQGVGTSLAWDVYSAIGYRAGCGDEVILKAEIERNPEIIDYDQSIYNYMMFESSRGVENEVVIKEGSELLLLATYRSRDPEESVDPDSAKITEYGFSIIT